MNQKTETWYIQVHIRAEMATKGNSTLLKGTIEADETYIGGKPHKEENKKEDREPAKRGRGTDKDAIINAVQRGGEVVAQFAHDLSGRTILDFIKQVSVKTDESTLVTDEFHGYRQFASIMKLEVINHQEQFIGGDKHTNTIEGLWSLLKQAWYGNLYHHYTTGSGCCWVLRTSGSLNLYHHYTTGSLPFYVDERCYVYQNRHITHTFWKVSQEPM